MKRKILVQSRYRQSNQTTRATLALRDLVIAGISEAGDDDAQLDSGGECWCFPKCLWKNKFSHVSINNSIGTKTDSDKLPAELSAQLEALEKWMNGYGKLNLEDKTAMS